MLTTLGFRYPPGREPAVITGIRQYLGSWAGVGRIIRVSMSGFGAPVPYPTLDGRAEGKRRSEGCWRYEAEEFRRPPGRGARRGVRASCGIRWTSLPEVSRPAPRRGAYLCRWVLDLEPGRYTVGFWIRVTQIVVPGGFLLVAIDDETGENLATRAVRWEDVAVGERYRRHDLVVEVPGPPSRHVEIRIEDTGRAAYLIDTVEVQHGP
jgi:hypothetical protein